VKRKKFGFKAPSTRYQAPEKFQTSNLEMRKLAVDWKFNFAVSLEL
jgi:hypothetical protein